MKSQRWVGAWCLVALGCGPTTYPGQTDGDGDECPITEPRGEVMITAYQGPAWVGLDVVGRFQRSTPVRESLSCARRTVGPCEVVACQNLGIDFVNGEPVCGPTSAGAIRVTRGAQALPAVDGSARLTLMGDLAAGEVFGVQTAGADVPPFAATLHLPARVEVRTPEALLRNGTIEVAASAGVAVTWAPTTARVLVIVSANNGGQFTAECAFDGATGAGEVPAAALPESTGNLSVWSEDRVDQRAGSFPVRTRVRWTTGAGATLVRGR